MPRVLLLDRTKPETMHDVFDLVELANGIARVRTAFLFEIGEELDIRVEDNGKVSDARARVRAHVGPADDKITELELTDRESR